MEPEKKLQRLPLPRSLQGQRRYEFLLLCDLERSKLGSLVTVSHLRFRSTSPRTLLCLGAWLRLVVCTLTLLKGSSPVQTEDKKHEIGAKLGLGKLPADLRDPDLLIRTGGEMRLSNFLLWNLAYTELYFTPVMWPDFDEGCFEAALDAYCLRERRFGARLGVPRKRKQKHLQVSG